MHRLEFAAMQNPKVRHYKLWQDGNKAKELHSQYLSGAEAGVYSPEPGAGGMGIRVQALPL